MHCVGVDIGGSHITACVYDLLNHRLCAETRVYRKVDTRDERGNILRRWSEVITECREKWSGPIEGLGLAMPGPFNYYEGICLIRGVEKLESLYNVSIRDALSASLGIEAHQIRFINDATAFAVAEARIGAASTCRRIVAITLGTGFGAAFLRDGEPIVNDPTVPAGGYLFDQDFNGQLADDVFSTRGIIAHYQRLTGRTVSNVRELCERADIDRQATETLHDFGRNLGLFLKPYLTSFEAEALVVGGNIARAFSFFGNKLRVQIPDVQVHVSTMGEDAAMIGGAMLIDDRYYESITPAVIGMGEN